MHGGAAGGNLIKLGERGAVKNSGKFAVCHRREWLLILLNLSSVLIMSFFFWHEWRRLYENGRQLSSNFTHVTTVHPASVYFVYPPTTSPRPVRPELHVWFHSVNFANNSSALFRFDIWNLNARFNALLVFAILKWAATWLNFNDFADGVVKFHQTSVQFIEYALGWCWPN